MPTRKYGALIDGFLLILLALIAAALRFQNLSVKYLDIDEAFQLLTTSKPTLKEMFFTMYSSSPQQYPLDYCLGFVATRFTDNIHLLRLLPMTWGLLSVIGLYLLGRLVVERSYGWLWAFLLGISVLHIQYSLTYRPYALIVFLSVMSLLSFALSLQNKSWLLFYGIATVLYQLVYPFAFCKSFVDLCVVFVLSRRQSLEPNIIRRFVAIILGSWLVFGLLLFFNVKGLVGGKAFSWPTSEVLGRDVLIRIALEYGQYSKPLAAIFAVLFIVGIGAGLTVSSFRAKTAYALALVVGTLLSLFVSMISSHVFLRARHTLPILPLFIGIIAIPPFYAAQLLERPFANRRDPLRFLSMVAATAVFFAMSMNTFKRYRGELMGAKKQIDEDVGSLAKNISPWDKIVLNNPNSGATFVYYYDRPAFFQLKGVELFQGFDFFRFPKEFRVSNGRFENEAFTQCRPDRDLATIDRNQFLSMRKETTRAGNKIWLVNLPLNYFKVSDPFRGLLDGKDRVARVASGIFFLSEQKGE